MFEQETETIISTIQRRTIGSGEAFAVKDILASDIPHAVKTFFRADVEAMLLKELRAYHNTSRFHCEHPEVQSLQQQINSILVLQYTFQRSEFVQRLNDAVHMIINYLVRPQWTLTSVLFENTETISAEALIGLLRYFGPYEYLKEIVTRYLHDKEIRSTAKKDFSSLIWKIDGEYIKRKSGDELARIVFPLYDFFDFPKATGNVSLPLKALMKYFEDKGLPSVMRQLEDEITQGRIHITMHELGELLESVRRACGAFNVETIEVEHTELITRAESAAAEAIPPTSTHGVSTPVQPFITFNFLLEEHERRRFVKKIFNNDEEVYRSSLESLGKLATWKQASKFIDELLIQNDVNPYSSDAERFIKIVFEQYHQKK
ncbi:MAG: hypothetical protein HYR76_07185 [Ignavibacteria bacterium]|nr:hypothetical protein [Ignavibacteria bacterium]MBI3766717.1 hypothetical protein [Ignavibacteriales bacterium]